MSARKAETEKTPGDTRPASPESDRAFTAEGLHGSTCEDAFAGALSFMRRRYTRDLEGADIAVSGLPSDLATTNRPGTRFGPRGIRAASAQLSMGAHWPWGFDPFDRLAVIDMGDVSFEVGRMEAMLEAIEAHADRILQAGVGMLSLGGDHLVTLPLLRAHARVHGPLRLVHFDAHSDTWHEEGALNHGTLFLRAAEEGLVDPAHSVQIGIRTDNPDTHGFEILDARWVHEAGTQAVVQRTREVVGEGKAYLTFDIDCLDPAFAPGTGTPVVGGLSTAQAQSILCGLTGIDFVAMDMVEVAPDYDVAEITSLAAASLALDYLCLVSRDLPDRES